VKKVEEGEQIDLDANNSDDELLIQEKEVITSKECMLGKRSERDNEVGMIDSTESKRTKH
jgi:hypothetical protein